MKNITLFILATLVITELSAQHEYADSVKYLTEAEEFTMQDKETKFLFKTSPLSYERKISTAYSISVLIGSSTMTNEIVGGDSFLNADIGLEGRYYLEMDDRVKAGQQKSNLSGNYISLIGFAGFGVSFDEDRDAGNRLSTGRSSGFSLNLGSQNRIHDQFYWDQGLTLEFYDFAGNLDQAEFSAISLTRKSNFGLAFGSKSKADTDAAKLPTVKVHVNRFFSLRVDRNSNFSITRFVNFNNQEDHWKMNFRPRINSELRIGKSPFTVYQEFRSLLRFSDIENGVKGKLSAERILYSYRVGGRFFYKMKNKVLRGKSGYDFSGPYFSTSFQHSNTAVSGHNLGHVLGGWGYQLEVGSNMYLDLGIKIPVKIYGDPVPTTNTGIYNLSNSVLEFKIGHRLFG